MDTLRQDVRYAARTLWKSRGFALVAIVTLALGIGASTAIFSVMDNVLMEPFPYVDAQRFMTVLIHDTESNEDGGRGGYTGPEFLDISEQNHVFDRVIANDQQDVLYRSGEGTELFKGSMVTPGTFEFMGMPPLIGRAMGPADYEPGAPPVFVMRYKAWVTKFSADPSILGKTFVLNDTPRTLIGIMPPRFGFGDSDVWIPMKPEHAASTNQNGFPQRWFLMGHLKPGVTEKQAQVDLDIVAHQIATKYPKEYPKHFVVQIQSLTDLVVGQFRTTLYIMLAAVGLLLLIGCGNVANLLLARATRARKGIRDSSGAWSWTNAADPAVARGEFDSRIGRSCARHTHRVGRTEIARCFDSGRHRSGRSGDSAKHSRVDFHAVRGGFDCAGVWTRPCVAGCTARSE